MAATRSSSKSGAAERRGALVERDRRSSACALAVTAVACYDPMIEDGQSVVPTDHGQCPRGFHCAASLQALLPQHDVHVARTSAASSTSHGGVGGNGGGSGEGAGGFARGGAGGGGGQNGAGGGSVVGGGGASGTAGVSGGGGAIVGSGGHGGTMVGGSGGTTGVARHERRGGRDGHGRPSGSGRRDRQLAVTPAPGGAMGRRATGAGGRRAARTGVGGKTGTGGAMRARRRDDGTGGAPGLGARLDVLGRDAMRVGLLRRQGLLQRRLRRTMPGVRHLPTGNVLAGHLGAAARYARAPAAAAASAARSARSPPRRPPRACSRRRPSAAPRRPAAAAR